MCSVSLTVSSVNMCVLIHMYLSACVGVCVSILLPLAHFIALLIFPFAGSFICKRCVYVICSALCASYVFMCACDCVYVCVKLIRACLDIAALRHNNNFFLSLSLIFFFPTQLLAAMRIFNYRLEPFVYPVSRKTTCVRVYA